MQCSEVSRTPQVIPNPTTHHIKGKPASQVLGDGVDRVQQHVNQSLARERRVALPRVHPRADHHRLALVGGQCVGVAPPVGQHQQVDPVASQGLAQGLPAEEPVGCRAALHRPEVELQVRVGVGEAVRHVDQIAVVLGLERDGQGVEPGGGEERECVSGKK